MRFSKSFVLAALGAFALSFPALAEEGGSEWYFSWGYNRDFWAPMDVHISQPGLNNDFTIHGVRGEDLPQWSRAFNKDMSVPQFNLRFGWYLEQQHEWAIEFSLDHTKYSSKLNQTARVTGTIAGQPVDRDEVLTPSFFNYKLHNGANHIMFSLVRRKSLLGDLNQTMNLSFLAKAGIGIMLPHAENTVMGNESDVGPKSWGNMVGTKSGWWQLNGVTAGAEVALRLVLYRPVFLEVSDKIAYARMFNVPVYQGRADHNLWMNAVLFAFGLTFNDHMSGP